MAFILVCGEHIFRNPIKGHEQVTVQCHNCGNYAGKLVKQWDWFTLCFIPVIPLGKSWTQVHCPICNFGENTKYRPDVQQILNGDGGGQQIPLQGGQNQFNGAPQGWNSQPPHGGGGQPQEQYSGQQGQPVYK